ncbi:MAG: hypothetical protein VKL39_22670 [Leptolyngbyaceae bacterium]|nr:hypothetical protein [Leptolyngbyaceae bacterium]
MMVEKNLAIGFAMFIQLTENDLAQMPTPLCEDLLKWLKSMNADPFIQSISPQPSAGLDSIKVEESKHDREAPEGYVSSRADNQEKRMRTHVLLSQLFDAGLTRSGMPVRVRLKRDHAKNIGRDYLNSLTISSKGTVLYDGEEFDKPSPLATKLNGSPVNGWEYIEVKKDNAWLRLENLRQQVR